MDPDYKSPDVVWHRELVTRSDRKKLLGHGSVLLWFTGLSGSGKSTIAHAVEQELHDRRCLTFVLDGDNVRHGLCGDLGFSVADRDENIRRIGELTKLFLTAGVIALTAFISPLRSNRERVRQLVGPQDFIEVFCHCPIEECERRDIKGLYKKARAGEIAEFTGISSPYEPPENPDLVLNTAEQSIQESVAAVIELLDRRKVL